MRKLIFALVLAIGCTTAQQPAQTQPTSAPANPEFKNLQVLPKNISREELLTVMRSFTRGLGVKCNYCHVAIATEPKEELDFASDANKHKPIARTMLRMVMDINDSWLQQLPEDERPAAGEIRVTCWTCHRGKAHPERMPAPAPSAAAPAS